jgi:hypothetical protein
MSKTAKDYFTDILDSHCAQLAEHFDSVEICGHC